VDKERGEEPEAYHQHVVADHHCGPAAWRVSWDLKPKHLSIGGYQLKKLVVPAVHTVLLLLTARETGDIWERPDDNQE